MFQFYVVEIQKYENGEFGHIVHYAYDESETKARLKAESKFFEVVSAAAVSGLPSHAAIMFSTEGKMMMSRCYKSDGTSSGWEESEE